MRRRSTVAENAEDCAGLGEADLVGILIDVATVFPILCRDLESEIVAYDQVDVMSASPLWTTC